MLWSTISGYVRVQKLAIQVGILSVHVSPLQCTNSAPVCEIETSYIYTNIAYIRECKPTSLLCYYKKKNFSKIYKPVTVYYQIGLRLKAKTSYINTPS